MDKYIQLSDVVIGQPIKIGSAFNALHFGEQHFQGLIDPVIMLDHFHMRGPTFDPHPHAGISAVTYLFEDSNAAQMNYDSLGNHRPIEPGALHWFVAGKGAIHTEQPTAKDAHIHALQIFVNLPTQKKLITPYAVHIESPTIPEFSQPGVRIRIVAGSTNHITAHYTTQLPEAFTLLDGFLAPATTFSHRLERGWSAMLYVLSGKLQIQVDGQTENLSHPQAMGISLPSNSALISSDLHLSANEETHFVLLSGQALNEPLAKHGPIIMNTKAQIKERLQAYEDGEFGHLTMPSNSLE